MYCITNKVVNIVNETNYKIGWVGKEKPPNHYITCNSKDNIFYKEKYYSELTFQYWYWKNLLDINNPNWIGFCQKRRFWIKKNSSIKSKSVFDFANDHLSKPDLDWNSFDAIICKSINVNKVKKIKLLKRGFRSIVKDPSIFFNEKKQTLALHFDMHHGYGNLDKAISVMDEKDRQEFKNYVNTSFTYNPHISTDLRETSTSEANHAPHAGWDWHGVSQQSPTSERAYHPFAPAAYKYGVQRPAYISKAKAY